MDPSEEQLADLQEDVYLAGNIKLNLASLAALFGAREHRLLGARDPAVRS